ncbi:hypothetical protein J4Q44_G00003680, partial [Coregonus suidteri]
PACKEFAACALFSQLIRDVLFKSLLLWQLATLILLSMIKLCIAYVCLNSGRCEVNFPPCNAESKVLKNGERAMEQLNEKQLKTVETQLKELFPQSQQEGDLLKTHVFLLKMKLLLGISLERTT